MRVEGRRERWQERLICYGFVWIGCARPVTSDLAEAKGKLHFKKIRADST